jgi:hypothetical protein
MKTAKPTKISAAPPQLGSTGATSAPKAARQIDTRVTSMSSSAHPVKGMAPVTPVRLSDGVSTTPKGCALVPFGMSVSVTVIASVVFTAPVSETATVPVTVPPGGRPADGATLIDSEDDPVPDAGLTSSHG